MSILVKLDEFLKGGKSSAAMAGQYVGRIFRRLLTIASLFFVALVLIAAGQLGQYMKSVEDLSTQTISNWNSDNPEKIQLSDVFIEKCLKGGPVPFNQRNMEDKPITVYDCGAGIKGAEELVAKIEATDKVLKNVAWPLSIANQ